MSEMRQAMNARSIALWLLVTAAILLSVPVLAQEGADNADAPKVPEAVSKRINDVAALIARRPDRLWISAYELRVFAGPDGEHIELMAPTLTKLTEHESEHVRLAAIQILLTLGGGDGKTLFESLAALIVEAEKSDTVAGAARLAAMQGLGLGESSKALTEAIEERLAAGSRLSAEARVNLAEALYEFKRDESSLDRLRSLAASSNVELRDRAALALSRQDQDVEVQGRVSALAAQSGTLALSARLTQEINADRKVIKEIATMGKVAGKRELVPAVVASVMKSYADSSMTFGLDEIAVDAKNLVDSAARGMVSSLDDYSQYLTAKEYRKANEEMAGTYVGIGAHVQKSEYDAAVRISQPIYGGPAYAAGLRSGDMLWELEVNGKRTSLAGMETEEVRNLLIGERGTPLKLFVKRPGTEAIVEINLIRNAVEVNTCEGMMLPGKIGYLKLTRFGGRSQLDVFNALAKLRDEGMKGIILDLRGNGGGYLHVVTQIAALFLPGDPPIALIQGVHAQYARPVIEYAKAPTGLDRRPLPWPTHDHPMVVLIDGSSASGSELLSGTLKDHNRATVIGEKSFGKGVGQATYPITKQGLEVEAKDDDGRMLKVTVFNYYVLPSKTSVERIAGVGGVVPHIEVHNPMPTTWEYYRSIDIARTGKLAAWVRQNWEKYSEQWIALADYDSGDPMAYSGIEELAKLLETPLPLERLRLDLRREIRSVVSDLRAKPFVQSYEEDFVLQRGIVEVGQKIKGLKLTDINEYRRFLTDHGVAVDDK